MLKIQFQFSSRFMDVTSTASSSFSFILAPDSRILLTSPASLINSRFKNVAGYVQIQLEIGVRFNFRLAPDSVSGKF